MENRTGHTEPFVTVRHTLELCRYHSRLVFRAVRADRTKSQYIEEYIDDIAYCELYIAELLPLN